MENENMTPIQPEEESYETIPSCEDCELTDCASCAAANAELNATDGEETADAADEAATETRKEQFARKCREVREACRNTATRLANDWKETAGNPYLKETCTYQVEVYRNADDEKPVDTFRTENVRNYSVRALVAIGGATLLLMGATGYAIKKLLK